MDQSVLALQLKEAVSNSLESELFANASWLGERLLAEQDSEEVRLLLAKAYMGEQKYPKAFAILSPCRSHECRYKLAQVAMRLNNLQIAERALLNMFTDDRNEKQRDRARGYQHARETGQVPGAAGYYLLGVIYDRKGTSPQAVECFEEALRIDPTLWIAYERLVKHKPNTPLTEIFPSTFDNLSPEARVNFSKTPLHKKKPRVAEPPSASPAGESLKKTPFTKSTKENEQRAAFANSAEPDASMLTPTPTRGVQDPRLNQAPNQQRPQDNS